MALYLQVRPLRKHLLDRITHPVHRPPCPVGSDLRHAYINIHPVFVHHESQAAHAGRQHDLKPGVPAVETHAAKVALADERRHDALQKAGRGQRIADVAQPRFHAAGKVVPAALRLCALGRTAEHGQQQVRRRQLHRDAESNQQLAHLVRDGRRERDLIPQIAPVPAPLRVGVPCPDPIKQIPSDDALAKKLLPPVAQPTLVRAVRAVPSQVVQLQPVALVVPHGTRQHVHQPLRAHEHDLQVAVVQELPQGVAEPPEHGGTHRSVADLALLTPGVEHARVQARHLVSVVRGRAHTPPQRQSSGKRCVPPESAFPRAHVSPTSFSTSFECSSRFETMCTRDPTNRTRES